MFAVPQVCARVILDQCVGGSLLLSLVANLTI